MTAVRKFVPATNPIGRRDFDVDLEPVLRRLEAAPVECAAEVGDLRRFQRAVQMTVAVI